MVMMQPPAAHHTAAPAAFCDALGALDGLGALLNCADPAAWASLARPGAPQLARIVYAIRGKLDEGMADLGLEPPPPPA